MLQRGCSDSHALTRSFALCAMIEDVGARRRSHVVVKAAPAR